MGLFCDCEISVMNCPASVTAGVPFTVEFLVHIVGMCGNCTASCSVGPENIVAACTLSAPGVPSGETIPIGQGETTVTATVVIAQCPAAGNIAVNVAVRCLDEFEENTCSNFAVCEIMNCGTP